jgi:hypothetical protein
VNARAKAPAPIALFPAPMDEFVAAVADRVFERLAGAGAGTGTVAALLDRRGIAEALSVGIDTVDKLRAQGLPTLWVIESPRFELAACLDWLRGRASK